MNLKETATEELQKMKKIAMLEEDAATLAAIKAELAERGDNDSIKHGARKARAKKEVIFEITDIENHSDPDKNIVYVHGEDIDGNSITVSFGAGVVQRREAVLREDVVVRAKVEAAVAGKTYWESKDGTKGNDEWSGYAGTFEVRRVAKSRWSNMQQAAKLKAYSKDSSSLEAIAALADAGANVNLNLI
jgi:hypothetical protein